VALGGFSGLTARDTPEEATGEEARARTDGCTRSRLSRRGSQQRTSCRPNAGSRCRARDATRSGGLAGRLPASLRIGVLPAAGIVLLEFFKRLPVRRQGHDIGPCYVLCCTT